MLIEVYSEGLDHAPYMHDFESQGMFVINSEIIPVTFGRGLFVVRLDPTTGAHEMRVSILPKVHMTYVGHLRRCSSGP